MDYNFIASCVYFINKCWGGDFYLKLMAIIKIDN